MFQEYHLDFYCFKMQLSVLRNLYLSTDENGGKVTMDSIFMCWPQILHGCTVNMIADTDAVAVSMINHKPLHQQYKGLNRNQALHICIVCSLQGLTLHWKSMDSMDFFELTDYRYITSYDGVSMPMYDKLATTTEEFCPRFLSWCQVSIRVSFG